LRYECTLTIFGNNDNRAERAWLVHLSVEHRQHECSHSSERFLLLLGAFDPHSDFSCLRPWPKTLFQVALDFDILSREQAIGSSRRSWLRDTPGKKTRA
jgi:hypothetical protein